MFPGIVFVVFFIFNQLIWGEKSSGALTFGTMLTMVFLWFGVYMPSLFVGIYFGYKKPTIKNHVKENKIPKQILRAGMPHATNFLPTHCRNITIWWSFNWLLFILESIWIHQFYYIFGFLLILFFTLIVTCAYVTILLYDF